jgi:hypothetical protein
MCKEAISACRRKKKQKTQDMRKTSDLT